jgi:hypothetical protein
MNLNIISKATDALNFFRIGENLSDILKVERFFDTQN